MKRKLIVSLLAAAPSTAAAQFAHEISLSQCTALFSTRVSSDTSVRVVSPLGVRLGYLLNVNYKSAFIAEYNLLSSGKSTMLHGMGVGFDYAFYGGQSGTATIPRNTVIMTVFPRRIGAFLSASYRNYNLTGIIAEPTDPLSSGVPTKGSFLGFETGLSFDQTLMGQWHFNARSALLYPWFTAEKNQTGHLISIAVGMNRTL